MRGAGVSSDPMSRAGDQNGSRGTMRALLSAFIMFHILAIFSWSLPIQSLIVSNFKERITAYMLAFSLFQNWDMFAPDPPMSNIHVDAEITFRNGETRVWKFPRMNELGLVEKYYKERYRKYANDHLRVDDGNSALRVDAARFVARLNNQPSNPPVKVALQRSWSDIRPPAPDGVYREGPLSTVVFFTYAVTSGDLK